MIGRITDIQKFSLHDGDGIRTTVFLKGCNMRCSWCHNPETISPHRQDAFYKDKCIHCGHCAQCPTGARVTIGREREAGDVFHELAADLPYYRASGGGVTISGGEPLLQADFCRELLGLCKDAGMGTAVETNLSLPFSELEKLLPYLDQVFFDIKLMDDAAHIGATGVSNQRVLRNARELARRGVPALVRTPLIPGLTDDEADVRAIAAFVSGLPNVRACELLNFNPLGEAKYEALGMEYAFGGQRPLPRARVRALAEAAM